MLLKRTSEKIVRFFNNHYKLAYCSKLEITTIKLIIKKYKAFYTRKNKDRKLET